LTITSIPNNFSVQTANSQVLLTWNSSAGATSYQIQRSVDNIIYVNYATTSVNSFLDTTVTRGITYFYQVASINVSGTSPFTQPQSAVPTLTGELSLGQIRLQAQQRADRVNSNFVTTSEWNNYINQAMFELYDLLTTVYEDYFIASPVNFITDGKNFLFPVPDGVLTFLDSNSNPFIPPPFFKLRGVDLALNNATNAYVTVKRFNFVDRNRFVYPNTASTIYGVFNLQYRLIGSNIEFIPTPSASQKIQLWYQPRLQQLLLDSDVTTIGISGWIEYVIVRAAKYALDKEESDTTVLTQEIAYLKQRIESSAMNRDEGEADTISDVRSGNWADGWTGGRNGAIGGF